MTLIMMLVCFSVNLISVFATVYIVLNDRMTVNFERSCVMACKIYMRYRLRGLFWPSCHSGFHCKCCSNGSLHGCDTM